MLQNRQRPGPTTVSDSAKPDIVRRAAGSTWLAAISGQCDPTGDAILQSTPCGILHDGDGSVATPSRLRDTRTTAVCGVQCLHVLPGLLPGGDYVSQEAV